VPGSRGREPARALALEQGAAQAPEQAVPAAVPVVAPVRERVPVVRAPAEERGLVQRPRRARAAEQPMAQGELGHKTVSSWTPAAAGTGWPDIAALPAPCNWPTAARQSSSHRAAGKRSH
jgi:hypothetical protein